MKKVNRLGKNILVTIAPAVLVYLLFFIVTRLVNLDAYLVAGDFGATLSNMFQSGFGVGGDLRTIAYNMVYSGFIALAMSYNLTSGRFDFSVGSVLILSLIAGGNIFKWLEASMGLKELPIAVSIIVLVLLVVVIGAVCGLVSGLIYITLKLPPMVTSLGVAMIFEAIGFSINNANGIKLLGRFNLLIWAEPKYSFLLMGIVLVILIFLLNFTKFGYNCRSLQTGQKNAVDVGVNEHINSVVCYIIAGCLMACAGLLYLSNFGYISPQTGLSSSSFLMSAFLPMFIGQSLAPYSDRNIGTVVGAFCQACLTSGLVYLGCSSSMKTVMDGVVVLLFLIYTSNSYKVGLHKMWKDKKSRALAQMAAAHK